MSCQASSGEEEEEERRTTNTQQVQLLCGKAEEAEVYHKVPYEIPILSKTFLNQYGMNTPGKYYYTKHKNSILEPADYKWVQKNFKNLQCQEFEQTHFWPLENVDHFSDVIAADIVDILVSDSTLKGHGGDE